MKLLYCTQLLVLPNKPRHADSSLFLIHIHWSTNTGFWEALASHVYVDPAFLMLSEFLHIDETPEFLGMCVIPERWSHPRTGNADDVLTLTAGRRPYGLYEALFESPSLTQGLERGRRRVKACWWSYRRISFRMWWGPKNSQSTWEAALKEASSAGRTIAELNHFT